MVETFSIERRKLMRAYGAKVILTPAAERGSGMVRRAKELAAKHGWFLARQFENPANPAYHRTPPARKSCATSPASGSTTSSAAGAPAARSPASARCSSSRGPSAGSSPPNRPAHPCSGDEWKPHKIQGWTPDFVPRC
jgi:cysteine synthase A